MKQLTYKLPFSPRLIGLFILVLIIFWALPDLLKDTGRNYIGTVESTRPIAQLMALVLGMTSLWAIISTIQHYHTHNFRIAWKASFRMVGWIPIILSATVVCLALVLNIGSSDMPWFKNNRTIESIIPLVIGVLSAMIFSPSDDATIETQLTLARPIAWVFLERIAIIIIPQAVIAIIGVCITLITKPELDLLVTTLGWIPPAIFLTGVGSYITLKSRSIALGMVTIGFLWTITLLFEVMFIPGVAIFFPLNHLQPYLWIFNPYLQPDALPIDAYWLNRLCLTVAGITLLAITVSQLRDEEAVLLGTSPNKSALG